MTGEQLEVAIEYMTASSKASRLLDLAEEMPKPMSELYMSGVRQAVRTMTEGGAWHADILQMLPENVILAWQLVEYVRLHGMPMDLVL